jgi:hypothetical protein
VGALGWARARLRRAFFRSAHAAAATDDAKAIVAATLRGLLAWRPAALPTGPTLEQPYPDLGCAGSSETALRSDIVFITARFRSGSTLLWNLFRNIPGHTSYYEPFNERRWFDPTRRGSRIDPTHRKAEEYWREYEGLSVLGDYYDESWIDHELYMDQGAWNPAMKRYVECLIERAPGRPVLQFNRIDFRLPWFRRHFPHAKLVHLYRHPRDQWMSSLVDPRAFPSDQTAAQFAAHDHFYLGNWACDLKYRFPFLESRPTEHPYRTFYYLWKLSYMFGRSWAHHSIAFEDLVSDPRRRLTAMFQELNVAGANLDELHALVVAPKPGRWRDYASERWFQDHEAACERVLAEFFMA